MDLISVKTIRKLCKQYRIRPSKKLGQNFLINKNILDKIIKAGELSKKDRVLEIGPGFGVLTQELVKYAGRVVAVEKDSYLAKALKHLSTEALKHKLKIINGDILKLPITSYQLPVTNYKIISNLPYNITSPILWKFLQQEKNKPELMVLMMQKEVAERIVAKPGKMSILSVMCQFYAECEIVAKVSKNNFWPKPDVDSAVVKLKIRPIGWSHVSSFAKATADRPTWSRDATTQQHDSRYEPGANMAREKEFLKIVKIGFSSKRKMLKNNLSKGLKISQEKVVKALNKAGLGEKVRAQELSVENWLEILDFL